MALRCPSRSGSPTLRRRESPRAAGMRPRGTSCDADHRKARPPRLHSPERLATHSGPKPTAPRAAPVRRTADARQQPLVVRRAQLGDRRRSTSSAVDAVTATVAKEWRAARNAGDCSPRIAHADGRAPTIDPSPWGRPTRGEAIARGSGWPRAARLAHRRGEAAVPSPPRDK